jgi:hypothetical protein
MIGAPLLVGSVGGLLLTALGTAGLVARILGEEAIRYRLVPYVW